MSVCRNCGWTFSGKYCPKCGTEYLPDEFADDFNEVTLSSYDDEDREAEARRNLWAAMHERYADKEKCQSFALELKTFAPEDYYADFAETVITGDDKCVSRFLKKSSDDDTKMYADAVLDYLCDRMTVGLYYAVVRYRDKASLKTATKYDEAIEKCSPDAVIRQREKENELRRRRESAERLEKENPGAYKRCVRVFTAKVLFSCVSVCLFLAMLVTLFVGLLYIADVGDIAVYIVLASVVAALFAVVFAMHISVAVGVRRKGRMSPDDACSLTSVWVLIGIISACATCSMIFWILDLAYDPGNFPFAGFVTIFVLSLAVLAYGIILSVSVRRLRADMNRAVGAYGTDGHRSIIAEAKIYAYGVTGSSRRRSSAADTVRGIFKSRLFYLVVLTIAVVAVIMVFTIRSASSPYSIERLIGGFNVGGDYEYGENLLGCSAETYSKKFGDPTSVTDGAWYWYDANDGSACNFLMATFDTDSEEKIVTSVLYDKNHIYDETDDFSTVSKTPADVKLYIDLPVYFGHYFEGAESDAIADIGSYIESGDFIYSVEYSDGSIYVSYLNDFTVSVDVLSGDSTSCLVEWQDELGLYSASVGLACRSRTDSSGVLTNWYADDGIIDIPEGVTSVADDALDGVTYINSITVPDEVTSLVIPNSVKKIGKNAFDECSLLESLTLYGGGETWENMLSGCKSLKTLVIGDGYKKIEDYAFYKLTWLESLTLPKSLKSIGSHSFYNCSWLTELTIPSKVKKIGDYAFAYCVSLEKVEIPKKTKTLGDYAFANCNGFTVVYYDAGSTQDTASENYVRIYGKKKFGQGVFSGCSSLTSAVIGDGVKKIPDYIFYECTSLESVTVADSVKHIGDYAFYDCSNLKSSYVSDNVKTIGKYAYYGCSKLSSISIHEKVKKIGKYAFAYCTSVTSISFYAKRAKNSSSDNHIFYYDGNASTDKGVKITIGNDVRRVPAYMFSPCSDENDDCHFEIYSLYFNTYGKCRKVRRYAFANVSIRYIYFSKTIKVLGDNAFKNCNITAVTYEKISSVGEPKKYNVPRMGEGNGAINQAKHYYY